MIKSISLLMRTGSQVTGGPGVVLGLEMKRVTKPPGPALQPHSLEGKSGSRTEDDTRAQSAVMLQNVQDIMGHTHGEPRRGTQQL